jgi:hypothetical protein
MGMIINPYAFGVAYDADAQAFFTAASITDNTQKTAVNQLVVDLKTYGIWTKMKALYPFVGGTSTTHKYNLKDPQDTDGAFRLVFSGGWTHSSTGALPNGTNGYADTKFIPSTNLTINSAHFSTYKRTNNVNANFELDGIWASAQNSGFDIWYNPSGKTMLGTSNSTVSYTRTTTTGLYLATRTSSSSLKHFRNSTNQGTNTNTITNIPTTYTVIVGARSDSGSIAYYNNLETAFASIGDGLNDTEAANFYTAVQAFQTTLSRNV